MLLGAIKRLDRGRRAAHHNRYAQHPTKGDCRLSRVVGRLHLALLIGWLVLFVKDDQPKVRQRRKQGRARPDDHVDLARTNALPLVTALSYEEIAMNDSNTARKTTGESLYSLRSKDYFRHQHDAAFAACDNCRQRLQIHLCLAASGDAM